MDDHRQYDQGQTPGPITRIDTTLYRYVSSDCEVPRRTMLALSYSRIGSITDVVPAIALPSSRVVCPDRLL
jgi:hypothetical protein